MLKFIQQFSLQIKLNRYISFFDTVNKHVLIQIFNSDKIISFRDYMYNTFPLVNSIIIVITVPYV